MFNLKIIIDDIPPSNNVFLGKKKSPWVYNKKKRTWEKLVWDSLPNRLPRKPLESVHVSIHYIFPDCRKRDLDNYSGKFLLDPLVKKGVIQDDSYQILSNLNLSAEYVKNIRKTIIRVEEVSNDS